MLHRISFRQMEYFVSTAQNGSIVSASEKIHVSPPCISTAIAHIEDELQVKLFIRQHARGLLLTAIGEKILKECLFILSQVQILYKIAGDYASNSQQSLNIGFHQSLMPLLYSNFTQYFNKKHKQLTFCIHDANDEELVSQLLSQKIDIALTTNLNIDPNLMHFEKIVSLSPYVLLSEQHPLAKLKAIHLEDLIQYPMILPNMPSYQNYCMGLFKQNNLQPNLHYVHQNSDLVRSMVADSFAFSITNLSQKPEYTSQGKKLIRLPIVGLHANIELGLATLRQNNLHENSRQFIRHSKDFIYDYYHPRVSTQKITFIPKLNTAIDLEPQIA